ncbi:hypothetical protein [Cronobacter sakazakii]|uniref:hypothetical protein n=1 Tax=Cronobacter sakazakii TaxID=28141 RepID=UPI001319E335|nr:hypothetical protein [Cronobacter sakazakii]
MQNALVFVAVIRTIHATHRNNIRACWRKRRYPPGAGKPTVNSRAGQSAKARRNAELSHF